jgi:ribonuclease R
MPSATQRLQRLVERLDLDRFDEPDGIGDEVHDVVDAPGLQDGVEDLEHIPFVTIDNPGSRDLDQALHVEETTSGWTVRYALADASYYVRPGTALFDRALQRGVTYYFPGFALPMLPPELSEGIISLNPAVRRRALLFETRVDRDGEVVDTDVRRVRIQSRAKLTYDGVQAYFDGAAENPVSETEWEASLTAFARLGKARVQRARARGMIEFERAEAEVRVSDDGERFSLCRRDRNDVERWNEQVSLLCNAEGARRLRELGAEFEDLQAVFRVHLPPIEDRLCSLREDLAGIANRHGLGDRWVWDGEQPLAEYLSGLPDEPVAVRRAVDRQVRYTNRASEFSDRHGPHYALALEHYARFSSPMREVVGIFTHKELLEALGLNGERWAHDEELRRRVIDVANDAKRLQKRIDKEVMLLAMDQLFTAELEARPVHTGTIIGLRATRLYVLFDELPLEVKVYVEDLDRAFGGRFEMTGVALRTGGPRGRSFGIGDVVEISVRDYDSSRRRWHFDVTPR